MVGCSASRAAGRPPGQRRRGCARPLPCRSAGLLSSHSRPDAGGRIRAFHHREQPVLHGLCYMVCKLCKPCKTISPDHREARLQRAGKNRGLVFFPAKHKCVNCVKISSWPHDSTRHPARPLLRMPVTYPPIFGVEKKYASGGTYVGAQIFSCSPLTLHGFRDMLNNINRVTLDGRRRWHGI